MKVFQVKTNANRSRTRLTSMFVPSTHTAVSPAIMAGMGDMSRNESAVYKPGSRYALTLGDLPTKGAFDPTTMQPFVDRPNQREEYRAGIGQSLGMLLGQRSYAGMNGLGDVDVYGNTVTYDNSGNAIQNYPDGAPMTDANDNPIADPNPTASANVSQAYASATNVLTAQAVNPAAATLTPVQSGSTAAALATGLINSLFAPSPAPAAGVAVKPATSSISMPMMLMLGIGGLFAVKKFAKK